PGAEQLRHLVRVWQVSRRLNVVPVTANPPRRIPAHVHNMPGEDQASDALGQLAPFLIQALTQGFDFAADAREMRRVAAALRFKVTALGNSRSKAPLNTGFARGAHWRPRSQGSPAFLRAPKGPLRRRRG